MRKVENEGHDVFSLFELFVVGELVLFVVGGVGELKFGDGSFNQKNRNEFSLMNWMRWKEWDRLKRMG